MCNFMAKLWGKVKTNLPVYAVAIAIPMAVGILSALLTKDSMGVYGELNSPPLSPPAPVFPIVWSILFLLMGISSGMVYVRRERNMDSTKKALGFYAVSLVINFSWSIIFFNLQAAFLAFLVLLALIYFIIRTILEYRKVYPIASYLQIPYLIWVIFAGYLNGGIWLLN